MSSKVVSIRMDAELEAMLNRWAEEAGVSRSEAAQTILRSVLSGEPEGAVVLGTLNRLYGEVQRQMPDLYAALRRAVEQTVLGGLPVEVEAPEPQEPQEEPEPLEGRRRPRRGRRGGG